MADMELEVSNATGGAYEQKPRIRKGYYPAKFVSCKPRQKNDGTPIEGKFGKQLILMFAIHNANSDGSIGDPVTVTIGDGRMTKDLELPNVVNSTYKTQDGKGERTAVTPNSRITQTFVALGWKFDETKKLKPSDYYGSWVEVNIDDYEYDFTGSDGKAVKVKASAIKDVKKWEGTTPSPSKHFSHSPSEELTASAPPEERIEENVRVEKAMTHEDAMKWKSLNAVEKRITLIDEMFSEGLINQEGYEKARAELNDERDRLKKP